MFCKLIKPLGADAPLVSRELSSQMCTFAEPACLSEQQEALTENLQKRQLPIFSFQTFKTIFIGSSIHLQLSRMSKEK